MAASRVRTRAALGVAVLTIVAAVAAFGMYGRQIVSFASHLTGSPTKTDPFEPFAPGQEPELRIAVAGDVGYANDRAARTGEAIAKAGAEDPYDVLLL